MTFYEQLPEAHKRFVDAYVHCLNYRKSYQSAYPDTKAYNTAKQLGHILANRPEVKEAIAEKLKEYSIPKEEVLHRMIQLVQFDLTDYMDGLKVNTERLNEDGYGWLLKSLSVGKVIKFDLMDKDKALENLAKIHNLFDDKQQINVNIQQEIAAKDQLKAKLEELDQKLNSYDGGK